MRFYKENQKGFALVELAIVLMIIGLLVGGVLRGAELLENARITATVSQVKAYMAANHTFKDKYGMMPGDFAFATSRLPGCDAGNNCDGGDSDGHVGEIYPDPTSINQSVTVRPMVETLYFWKHLALAHLITGVDPSANLSTPTWEKTNPAAKVGGGFTIFYSTTSGDYGTGHNLRLQIGPKTMGGEGTMAVSPITAQKIDQKMDNGLPDTGDVTADYSGSNCDAGGRYQNLESKNCMMFFNID